MGTDREFDQFVMRPGDTFVADECGCSFTVESGPSDARMVRQAPVCCCGHAMHKEFFGSYRGVAEDADASAAPDSRYAPDMTARA